MSDDAKVQFVKKLDIPAEFDEIPSNRLTVSSLKEHEQTKYNTWFNHFWTANRAILPSSKGPLKWIADNHELIAKYIRDTYVRQNTNPALSGIISRPWQTFCSPSTKSSSKKLLGRSSIQV